MKEYIKDTANCPHAKTIHGTPICELEVARCDKVEPDKCKRIVRAADVGEQMEFFEDWR